MRSIQTIILSCCLLFAGINSYGQKAEGKLKFDEGTKLVVYTTVKTSVIQQAMGNAIDFTADGSAIHSYTVTKTSAQQTTLHHQPEKIIFMFDGMGRKFSFDSENKNDMSGQFGKAVNNILRKEFDVTIDNNGKVLAVDPEKTETVKADERLTMVFNMLKDITDVVYPPKKGEPGFFKVLPPAETAPGKSWTDSLKNKTGTFMTTYTLSAITDSTIVVDFTTISATISNAMMMGRETVTTMSSTGHGTIILDKLTGIIKEKRMMTESNGHTEAMGGSVPVTAKTTITIQVNPE
jgi:hypothetical protein